MGTRADFYEGIGNGAVWLGSIGWDGYPEPPGVSTKLRFSSAKDEQQWRTLVSDFLDERDDATRVDEGWPWPWPNSATTDYAYAFHMGKVWVSNFGHTYIPIDKHLEKTAKDDQKFFNSLAKDESQFPDMTGVQNVSFGKNSGLTVMGKEGP